MISVVQSIGLSVITFLVVLGLVVTIHELGHFVVAKTFGVAIEKFSIGFGRAIFSRTDRSGVEWQIGWIPLGGYVRFAGDENDASVPDQNDLAQMRARIIAREGPGAERKYFPFKPLWQRAMVAAAGPVANFLLAIILFSFLFAVIGQRVTPAVVGLVAPNTPAARADFRVGDRIISADGNAIADQGELVRYVTVRDNQQIDFVVLRNAQPIHILATPARVTIANDLNIEQRGGQLGLGFSGGQWVRYPLHQAVVRGVVQTGSVINTTVFYLGRMITGQVPADQIGGPLQIAQVTGAVANASLHRDVPLRDKLLGGAVGLVSLAAFISVSVGFMNLLPVPVLDGGHLLFYAYEAVARRPLAGAIQSAGYRVGLALLLCLMLFATWNDLQRLRVFQSFGGLFS